MKMVIVMRTDLNMRKGKMIAQGGHASMIGFTQFFLEKTGILSREKIKETMGEASKALRYWRWVGSGMTKICVQVNSEQALEEICKKARSAGVECQLVMDAGHTEFHGVITPTCCAVGPDEDDKVDAITGELKLL